MAEARGITFVPEAVSSAGALIVDSIEFYDSQSFNKALPQQLYDFTHDVVREKTQQLFVEADRLNVTASVVAPLVAAGQEASGAPPTGMRFAQWLRAPTPQPPFDAISSAASPSIPAQQARCTSSTTSYRKGLPISTPPIDHNQLITSGSATALSFLIDGPQFMLTPAPAAIKSATLHVQRRQRSGE
mmetsp:Transcript_17071/g.34558  ORF Transcript_17071/g.34558 Transcript_17071/m.34558 type:complete len:187 (+) Transcript_17071:870-1430(+)